MIHGYGETHLINDLDSRVIKIEPCKNFQRLDVFQDKYYEELKFPKLFYGSNQLEDIMTWFSYQEIVQWDLLHKTIYIDAHTINIFFKTIQIL